MNRRTFIKGGLAVLTAGGLCSTPSLAEEIAAGGVWTERMEPMMGTFVSVAVFDSSAVRANSLITETFDSLRQWIFELSDRDSLSSVSRLNTEREIDISEAPRSLKELLPLAVSISALSGGAFSPLALEASRAWRESRQRGILPPRSELKELCGRTRATSIQKMSDRIKLRGPGSIEFGGVGKGYLVDRAADFLSLKGVRLGRVAGYGDIRFIGNRNWSVEIEHPRSEDRLLGITNLTGGGGVATSGDYRNFEFIGRERVHHLIDLQSGEPANWNQAVTVKAATAAMADGISTAAFLMPTIQALRWLEELTDVEGVIVDSKGQIHQTKGFGLTPA